MFINIFIYYNIICHKKDLIESGTLARIPQKRNGKNDDFMMNHIQSHKTKKSKKSNFIENRMLNYEIHLAKLFFTFLGQNTKEKNKREEK